MDKKSSQPVEINEGLSINDIVIILLNSKKIILTITLAITLLTSLFIFSIPQSFNSSALIEIGEHNFHRKTSNLPSTNELIELPGEAIREMEINFQYKKHEFSDHTLVFTPIADRLARIETITPSIEIGRNYLNQVVSFIIERHKNITNSNLKINLELLENEISGIEESIKFNENQLFSIRDSEFTKFKNKFKEIESKLEYLNYEIESSLKNELKAEKENIKTKIRLLNDSIIEINEALDGDDYLSDSNNSNQAFSIAEYFMGEKNNLEVELNSLNASIYEINKVLETGNSDDLLSSQNIAIFNNSNFLLREKNNLENELNILRNSISEINNVINSDLIVFISEMPYSYNESISQIFELKSQLEEKNQELRSLKEQKTYQTSLIGEITANEIKKPYIYIIISFVLGIILSIFIVLFIDFYKSIKTLRK